MVRTLKGKCVVLGVTGGIAAYKAAEIVSGLTKAGVDVHVIMTEAAQRFITPLTLQTLSKNPVITNMFAEPKSWEVQHIALADRADAFLIAPASANVIGKMANGIADDMLSTTVMATTAPVIVAPAMNVHMYDNPILQRNCQTLQALGYQFVDSAVGRLACGYEGKGRLAPVEEILERTFAILQRQSDLAGLTLMVTAGATREAIDPVRFITNHSTGKMGYAVARAAQNRGARVILVSGPTNLPIPAGIEVVAVESAQEMHQAVLGRFSEVDVVVKTAAVADYRPLAVSAQKVKKAEGELHLELVRNPDILRELGQNKGKQILVGFAAETNDLHQYAARKIADKNLDLIVANDVTQPGAGFGTDTNIATMIFPDGRHLEVPQTSKDHLANLILDQVKLLQQQRSEK